MIHSGRWGKTKFGRWKNKFQHFVCVWKNEPSKMLRDGRLARNVLEIWENEAINFGKWEIVNIY